MQPEGSVEDELEIDQCKEPQENTDAENTPTKNGSKRTSTENDTPIKKLKKEDEDVDEIKEISNPSKVKTPSKLRGPKSVRDKAQGEKEEQELNADEKELQEKEKETHLEAKPKSKLRGPKSARIKVEGEEDENEDENEDEDETGEYESSDDDELSQKKKGTHAKAKPKSKLRGPKSARRKANEEEGEEDEDESDEEGSSYDEDFDDEGDEDLEDEEDESDEAAKNKKPPKEFTSGAFVVLKSEFNAGGDPTIYRIDGKALLQKYASFTQDGKLLYRNTSVYTGWSIRHKNKYYPATVLLKNQTRKEHVVEFQKDLIQREETSDSE